MSRLTCSWLIQGPGASHLYTQLYTLYVKGSIIGELQLSLQSWQQCTILHLLCRRKTEMGHSLCDNKVRSGSYKCENFLSTIPEEQKFARA